MVQPWHQLQELAQSQQTSFRTSDSQSSEAIHIRSVRTTRVQPWRQLRELAQSQRTSFHTSDTQRSEAIPIHNVHTTRVQLWHQRWVLAVSLQLVLSGPQPQKGQLQRSVSW